MTIALTPRAWSGLHTIAASRTERIIAILVVFTYAAQFPTQWFLNDDNPAIIKVFPGYYELIFRVILLAIAWSAAGWSASSLVTAMRLEPLIPLLMTWVVATSLWSSNTAETFRHSGYLLITVAFGYWLAIRFSLTDIIGLAAVGFIGVILLEVAFIISLPRYGDSASGWTGTLTNKNTFGRMMSLAVLILVIAARTQRRHRFVLWCFAVTAVVLTIGSNSKTGLIAVLGMLGMTAVFAAFRARRTLYGAIAVSITVGAALITWVGLGNRAEIASALGKDPHLSGRTQLWIALFKEIGRRPLQGFGYHGYWTGYGGPSTNLIKFLGWIPGHAHNAFFQAMLEIGIVGFALVLALTIRLIVRSARVVRWYRGTIGLFPLLFASLTLLISITEFGIIRSDAMFLFLVPACIGAARGRKDVLTFERAQHIAGMTRSAIRPTPSLVGAAPGRVGGEQGTT
jgi:exopolysaccharide production protein ExoQ